MAFEIPSARIRELQCAIRRSAGVPSYDPNDPSLPPLPSVADVVATLYADLPASHRCGRCSGALLRGPQSTLCIYCGADRGAEAAEQSISFNSTAACRKLLDVLGVDGSETVVLETESTGSRKSQAAVKDELALSDLLDLELRWPSNKEVESSDSLSKVPTSSAYDLNLKALDFDTFFNQIKKEAASIAPAKCYTSSELNEQAMQRKHNEGMMEHRLSTSESFAEFEKLETSKASTTTLVNDNQGDTFTPWEAEFQSASSENFNSDSKPQDLFQNSSAVFVQGPRSLDFDPQAEEQHESIPKSNASEFTNELSLSSSSKDCVPDEFWDRNIGKAVDVSTADELKVESDSTIGDRWIDDNQWLGKNSKESYSSTNINFNNDLFDTWIGFAKSETKGDASNFEAQTEDLFENSSEMKVTGVRPVSTTSVTENDGLASGNDDYFGDWNDFTGSSKREDSLSNIQPQTDTISFEHSLETYSVYLLPIAGQVELNSSLNSNANGDLFDPWKDFSSSSEARGNQLNPRAPIEGTLFHHSSEAKTLDFWPSSSQKELENNKSSNGNDDSDDWQDFTSFSTGQEGFNFGPQSSAPSPLHHLETNSGDIFPMIEEKEFADVNDDSFDDWQDFTSSSEATGNLVVSQLQYEPMLFGDVSEIESVGHQDSLLTIRNTLLDAPENHKNSSNGKDNKLDASTSDRMNSTVDLHFGEWQETADEKKPIESSVEKLMSRIPDLSFMLADELSIPKKPNVSDSSSNLNVDNLS